MGEAAPLKRTEFGASHDAGETVYSGATRSGAIDRAVENWREKVDCGDLDEPTYPHTLKLQLYTDLIWCVGPTVEHEDCYCGRRHLDHGDGRSEPWLLMGWGNVETIEHEVTA